MLRTGMHRRESSPTPSGPTVDKYTIKAIDEMLAHFERAIREVRELLAPTLDGLGGSLDRSTATSADARARIELPLESWVAREKRVDQIADELLYGTSRQRGPRGKRALPPPEKPRR